MRRLRGYNGIDLLLLDVIEFDLILEGEKLYEVDFEDDSSKTLYLAKEIDKLKVLKKYTTIPAREKSYFGVICNEQISIWTEHGKHRDKVATYNLENINEKTIFEIEIEIDSKSFIKVTIKEQNKQKIIWEVTL